MTSPVYVEAVCPSCEGRCCVVCGNTGVVAVRLADHSEPVCARCRVHCVADDSTADTLRPNELPESDQ